MPACSCSSPTVVPTRGLPHTATTSPATLTERSGPGAPDWHNRLASLELKLRGAYDDGTITLRYPTVHSYNLDGFMVGGGHADWRYDELRIDEAGHLVHEVEWCFMQDTARG